VIFSSAPLFVLPPKVPRDLWCELPDAPMRNVPKKSGGAQRPESDAKSRGSKPIDGLRVLKLPGQRANVCVKRVRCRAVLFGNRVQLDAALLMIVRAAAAISLPRGVPWTSRWQSPVAANARRACLHECDETPRGQIRPLALTQTHDDLRDAFEAHLLETEGHVQKVECVFELFGKNPKSKKCPAIVGIIKEANEIAAANKKSPTINAALIFAAQKAEHYEIASYGGLHAWAKQLNNDDAAALLDEILDEEKLADNKLTALAETYFNISARTSDGVESERALARAA
jgi:ferritin-like metal-binding protein YciE